MVLLSEKVEATESFLLAAADEVEKDEDEEDEAVVEGEEDKWESEDEVEEEVTLDPGFLWTLTIIGLLGSGLR